MAKAHVDIVIGPECIADHIDKALAKAAEIAAPNA
jgi:hypothetical protein